MSAALVFDSANAYVAVAGPSSLSVPDLAAGDCADAYFNAEDSPRLRIGVVLPLAVGSAGATGGSRPQSDDLSLLRPAGPFELISMMDISNQAL